MQACCVWVYVCVFGGVGEHDYSYFQGHISDSSPVTQGRPVQLQTKGMSLLEIPIRLPHVQPLMHHDKMCVCMRMCVCVCVIEREIIHQTTGMVLH